MYDVKSSGGKEAPYIKPWKQKNIFFLQWGNEIGDRKNERNSSGGKETKLNASEQPVWTTLVRGAFTFPSRDHWRHAPPLTPPANLLLSALRHNVGNWVGRRLGFAWSLNHSRKRWKKNKKILKERNRTLILSFQILKKITRDGEPKMKH
jgi:hypothetical protein